MNRGGGGGKNVRDCKNVFGPLGLFCVQETEAGHFKTDPYKNCRKYKCKPSLKHLKQTFGAGREGTSC